MRPLRRTCQHQPSLALQGRRTSKPPPCMRPSNARPDRCALGCVRFYHCPLVDMTTERDIEVFTRDFLSSINLGKYEMVPSEQSYREVKVHKLDRAAKPGDHVAVWREERGYWHHGIYCGEDANDDAFVVDLTPEHGIALRPFENFIHGEDTSIVIDYDDHAFTKNDSFRYANFVVQHAKECPIKYDAVKRNCDMLALMLRTGRWGSPICLHRPGKQRHRASYSISAKLGL